MQCKIEGTDATETETIRATFEQTIETLYKGCCIYKKKIRRRRDKSRNCCGEMSQPTPGRSNKSALKPVTTSPLNNLKVDRRRHCRKCTYKKMWQRGNNDEKYNSVYWTNIMTIKK